MLTRDCSPNRVWEERFEVQVWCGDRVWEGLEPYLRDRVERAQGRSVHVFVGKNSRHFYRNFMMILSAAGVQAS